MFVLKVKLGEGKQEEKINTPSRLCTETGYAEYYEVGITDRFRLKQESIRTVRTRLEIRVRIFLEFFNFLLQSFRIELLVRLERPLKINQITSRTFPSKILLKAVASANFEYSNGSPVFSNWVF